jgi:N-methylhydantoinase B
MSMDTSELKWLRDQMMQSSSPQSVDPVRLEVIRNSLIRFAEQMAATVQRTAYSIAIYEGVDFVCGVLDTDRNLLTGTAGIPAFLGNLPEALSDIDNMIGIQNIEPGDMIFCNDPYFGGGTHGNDIAAFYPLFNGGKLYGFTAFKGNTLDVGGIHPGGYYNNTTEIYQELFRIVPVKLYRKGEPNEDVFRLIRANCRTPEIIEGDIRSIVSATKVGAAKIQGLVDKYGLDQYQLYVNEILAQSERVTREQIKSIPEGEYSGEYVLDGDGDDGEPHSTDLRVHMKLTVKGDEMYVDMSESSPQSKGSLNCSRASSISFIRYGFKSVTTPFLPINDGCFRPLHIKLKRGTLLDPVPPAAVSLWIEVGGNGIPDLFMKVLAPAIPDRVRASTFGSDVVDFAYGTDPRNNQFYVVVECSSPGGWGASKKSDGATLWPPIEGDSYYPMVEVFEVDYPFLVEKFELIQDSGGAGKFRGGLGVNRTISPIDHDSKYIVAFERQKRTKPWGLFGGKDGHANYCKVFRKDGSVELHEKVTDFVVYNGERIQFLVGGGGGWGEPFERDPRNVLSDVLDGYVSKNSAEKDYGIVFNPETYEVDQLRTEEYRSSHKSSANG